MVPSPTDAQELVSVSSNELVASVEHGREFARPGFSSAEHPPHVETQDEQQFTETQQGPTTMLIRGLSFLGQGPAGTVDRKSLVRFIWNLSWGVVQVWFFIYLMTYDTIQHIRLLLSLSC
jgi:hypothetical protein